MTEKGRGFAGAATDRERGHAVSAPAAPGAPPSPPKYQDVFAQTVIELAKDDPRIMAITAAMPTGTSLAKFQAVYPDRFFDVGIAEQHAVTFAAGLAAEGMRPVVGIYSTFLQRAYDQIIHDVCLQRLPVTFAIDRAGFAGDDGRTHHGIFDLSYLRCLPNMTVMAPKDENELRHMLKTALDVVDGPVAIRYPRGAGVGAHWLTRCMRFLSAGARGSRSGSDVAILALGTMVLPAERAADLLAAEGISASVVNARFVKPLDERLILELAARCGAIVTVEENVKAGGFGSAVLELPHQPGCAAADSGARGPGSCLRAGVPGPAAGVRRADARSYRRGRARTGRAQARRLCPGAFSHRASPSGRLGGIEECPLAIRQVRIRPGEDIVNPISGASSLSAEAATDAETTPFLPRNDWSGLADASGRLGVSLDDSRLGALRPLPGSSPRTKHAFNLTAIRDPAEIERRLFLDAIAMVPELDRSHGDSG